MMIRLSVAVLFSVSCFAQVAIGPSRAKLSWLNGQGSANGRGLVAYWDFTGRSGLQSLPGAMPSYPVLQNGATSGGEGSDGTWGTDGVALNGSSQYLMASSTTWIPTTIVDAAWGFCAVARDDSDVTTLTTTAHRLVGWGADGGSNNVILALATNSHGDRAFIMESSVLPYANVPVSGAVPTGWHSICGFHSATNQYVMYLDGVASTVIGAGSVGGYSVPTVKGFWVGQRGGGVGYWNGKIATLAFWYGRVPTSTEVREFHRGQRQMLATRGITLPYTTPAYWYSDVRLPLPAYPDGTNYPTYATIVSRLNALCTAQSWTCQDTGTTVQSRAIRTAIIHGTSYTRTIALDAGIHGDEKFPVIALMDWVEWLATSGAYSTTRFIVTPVYNPDGWEANTRQNNHGVDLNRNHAEGWAGGNGGASPNSEPETQAMRALYVTYTPDYWLNLHSTMDLAQGSTGVSATPWNAVIANHRAFGFSSKALNPQAANGLCHDYGYVTLNKPTYTYEFSAATDDLELNRFFAAVRALADLP